jgi:hypothetical protein
MLASIPGWKLLEWQAFYDLEPDGDERNDWGFAHVVQALVRNGKQLSEFKIPFGDEPRIEPVKQTIEEQERLIDAWIFGSNAIFAAKAAKGQST